MRLTTFVYRNLTRRRVRSALTVCGMAVAVSAVVALVGIADGFRQSFLDLYAGNGIDVIVVRARSADRMASELDETLGPRIAGLEGVASVEPVLMDAISLEDSGQIGVVLQGLDPAAPTVRDLQITAGRTLRSGEQKSVLLGRILAQNLGKQIGDKLEIYEGEDFEVIGTYDRQNLFENGSMIVPLAELQRMLGQEGLVTAFNVTVAEPRSAETIAHVVATIDGMRAGLSAMATEEYVATDNRIRGASAMAWSTSAIALVIGAIGMLNTMIVAVFERTGEIGILRAIGWRKGRIVQMILLESSLLCLAGAVVGTGLAFLMTYLLSRAPATAGLVSATIPPHVVAQGFVIALLIGLLGASYPAFRASRLTPTTALRHEG
ncbi:MAG: ABC transporter permease [Pirellulales bacterium]|nr:ABC transporter permease [Pirellulales bacterium]